jgi:hypothetical protein
MFVDINHISSFFYFLKPKDEYEHLFFYFHKIFYLHNLDIEINHKNHICILIDLQYFAYKLYIDHLTVLVLKDVHELNRIVDYYIAVVHSLGLVVDNLLEMYILDLSHVLLDLVPNLVVLDLAPNLVVLDLVPNLVVLVEVPNLVDLL